MSAVEEIKNNAENMIVQVFGNHKIRQMRDGKLCATDACKAAGKNWSNYIKNKQTKEFLEELSKATGLLISELVL